MRSFRLILLLGLSAMLAAACGAPQVSDVGGGSSQGDDDDVDPTPTPAGQFITVESLGSDIDLKETKKIDFVVRGGSGFTGNVTVELSNLPAGVSATSTSTVVNVTSAETDFPASFDITSDNAVVAPGSYTVHLAATAGALTAAKDAPLAVNPFLTMDTASAKGAGSFLFWDPAGDFQGNGTVVHLGNATMITFAWKKSWAAPEADHRIHGNNAGGTINGVTSQSALAVIVGMPCDLDGRFSHSAQCNVAPMASDETGKGATEQVNPALMFRRTLRPSDPAATTVITFYDHLTGTPGGAASDLPGKITIMP